MKAKYIGSVRFFKHLIILTLFIVYITPWVVVFFQSSKITRLEKNLNKLTVALRTLKTDKTKKKNNYKLKHPTKLVKPKVAYLTFDDGPSELTGNILDILKKEKVKATFFVTYSSDVIATRMLKRIVDEGHTVGLHSYTHRYDIIYQSCEAFINDIDRLNSYIFATTGYIPKILRFPGGSNCSFLSKSLFYRIESELSKRGLIYFDWNVCSNDSYGSFKTADEIVNNCYYGAIAHSQAIILLHDTSVKKWNVAVALPVLIKKLKQAGFEFSMLSESSPRIVFRK